MVFGLRKANNFDESFQSVASSGSEFDLDDPSPALIRGRRRRDESVEGRARTRSTSAARRIAAAVVKFSGKKTKGDENPQKDEEKEDLRERPSFLPAPSMAVIQAESQNKSSEKRWRSNSKTPNNRRGDHFQRSEIEVKESNDTSKRGSKQEDERHSPLPSSSDDADYELEEIPVRSPAKSPRRRWRTPIKSRDDNHINLPDGPPSLDNENDDASDHGSVVASVVSMFEWRKKPADRSVSPRRIWRPRNNGKENSEICAAPINDTDDHSENTFSVRCEEVSIMESSVRSSPVKQRPSSQTSSNTKSPRRIFKNKTAESSVEYHVSRPSKNQVSKPSKRGYAVSEADSCIGRANRPNMLAAPSTSNFNWDDLPKLSAPNNGSLGQKDPNSLPGVLKSSSYSKSAGKSTGKSKSSKRDPGKKEMTHIQESEKDDEQSLMDLSFTSLISTSEKSNNSFVHGDEPSLAKDVQEWRENRSNGTFTRSLGRHRSSSEHGTRSSVGLHSPKNGAHDKKTSRTVASLVTPTKKRSQKNRSSTDGSGGTGGALPEAPDLHGSDEMVRKDRRSHESSSASGSRGRSRGTKHRETSSSRPLKTGQVDSKSSTTASRRGSTSSAKVNDEGRGKSVGHATASRRGSTSSTKANEEGRGKSVGRATALRRGSTSSMKPSESTRHSTRRSSLDCQSSTPSSCIETKKCSATESHISDSPRDGSETASDGKALKDERSEGRSKRESTPTRRKPLTNEPKTPSRRSGKVGADFSQTTNSEGPNAKRDISEETKLHITANRAKTPIRNSRLRSKSVGRPKSPMVKRATKNLEGLAAPGRTRPKVRVTTGGSVTSLDIDAGSKTTMSSRPNRETRQAGNNVKTIRKQHQTANTPPTIAQLHIPSLTELNEGNLQVEYCEAAPA